MSDADVHATRALLYLTGRGTRTRGAGASFGTDDPKAAAKREVEEALRARAGSRRRRGALRTSCFKAPVDVAQATARHPRHDPERLAGLGAAGGRAPS